MSDQIPEGSGKQFGEDVADLEHEGPEIPEGSGKEFAEGQARIDEFQPGGIPEGSGKQFAPGHDGDPDLDIPEGGKGFARGQSPEAEDPSD